MNINKINKRQWIKFTHSEGTEIAQVEKDYDYEVKTTTGDYIPYSWINEVSNKKIVKEE